MESINIVRRLECPEVGQIHGLTWDGETLWCADGAVEKLARVDPATGRVLKRLDVHADAGTGWDGAKLWQISRDRAQHIDPATGTVERSFALPDGNGSGLSVDGDRLWVGNHAGRFLLRVEAATGRVLQRIDSDAHVCGVTFSNGALWHCAWTTRKPAADGHVELRRLDPQSGHVLHAERVPEWISGIEGDGSGDIWAGTTAGGRFLLLRPRS